MKPIVFPKLAVAAILTSCLFFVQATAIAQPTGKKVSLATKDDRPSPPAEATGSIGDLKVKIVYSQPGVKGRTIWGELVPYGKVWRTGANEASTIEVSRDTKAGGGMLRAGKYAIFSIPGETEWTIILNSVPDQWGAYKYDETKDALRFKVKPEKSAEFNERLKFEVKSDPTGEGKVSLYWENLKVSWEMR